MMWYNSNTLEAGKNSIRDAKRLYPITSNDMDTAYSHKGDNLIRTHVSGHENLIAAIHTFPSADLDTFAHFALDAILDLVDADFGSLFLWDEFAKALVPRAIRSKRLDRIRDSRIKLKEGISGIVADQGHCVLVKNIHGDSRFFAIQKNGSYNSPSFICLPLIVSNKLVGIINVTERENLTPFNEENFEQVRAVAIHVAIACEKVRALENLRRKNEELTRQLAEVKSPAGHHNGVIEKVRKLASHWSHELNDPLDAIRRYVNLAIDQLPDDSLAKDYMFKAKAGMRRAIHATRALMVLSDAVVDNNLRTSDLNVILDDILAVVLQDPEFQNVSFVRDFCPAPLVVSDAGLQTVFMNLLNNARHAMAGKGEIRLTSRRKGASAVVTVQDSGPGIPEHLRPRIFEPFFSTKKQNEGKGIGLCISRDIVVRCGGNISFDSCENKGTTFVVTLPCQEKASA